MLAVSAKQRMYNNKLIINKYLQSSDLIQHEGKPQRLPRQVILPSASPTPPGCPPKSEKSTRRPTPKRMASPLATIPKAGFGDRPSFGEPFAQIFRHSDPPLRPSFPGRRFSQLTPRRILAADRQSPKRRLRQFLPQRGRRPVLGTRKLNHAGSPRQQNRNKLKRLF